MTQEARAVELRRDCDGVQIPHGQRSILPRGTTVEIVQTLGGSFTVRTPEGAMFSMAGKDADALGMETVSHTADQPPSAPPVGPLEETKVWEVLRTCYDPEIPVNIVDLGLIYDLGIEPLTGGLHRVQVKMTLTAPGCGMGTYIAADAREKLLQTPGISEATVDVVWDPPWHPSMITAEGRRVLGIE
jgi:probable FeS assembly SUF system protein SufT